MSEPRVAFLIHGLVVGGAEKFFISLVNHFQRSGRNPLVILLSDDNALFSEMDADVNSVIIKRKYKYDLAIGKQIREVLDKNNVDKVFCVGIFSFFLMKLYYRNEKRKQFFLSLHSTIPATRKEHWLNFIYYRSIADRDKVLFICQAQKEYLGKKYFFKPKQSEVIYNGIDTDYFHVFTGGNEVKTKLKLQYKLAEGDKVIVKIARMFPEKGHKYGIEALDILHREYNCKAHLLFVGSGDDDYLASIRTQAANSGVADYIHFIDHQKDVRPFHHMADVFTLTSYTIETFSLAALEAMSSGIPASLTNIGGAAEMINERNGMISQSKNPSSIAKTWFELLQKQFDPQSLHDHVEEHYSLDRMLCNYKKALLPEAVNLN